MKLLSSPIRTALLLAIGLLGLATSADAQTLLRDICRIKGQEQNTLQGLGIVVGLKGTGDGDFTPTYRNLAKALTVLKEPLGQQGLLELKNSKNIAMVIVTVTIPATGAVEGELLDCTVSSIGSAKSLAGGRLFLTPVIGPNKHDPRIFGFTQGAISLDDPNMPTSGHINNGCRLEEDFIHPFRSPDGSTVTIVLDKNHADFRVAERVVVEISGSPVFSDPTEARQGVRATSPGTIEVTIPSQYREDPVPFIAELLAVSVPDPRPAARVVIHERAGSIVISGDTEISAVAVTHKNGILVQTGGQATETFVPIDPDGTSATRLKSLVAALNAVHVPPEDIIDIIKGLDRIGALHARLIIE